jgi:FkbH-like protein
MNDSKQEIPENSELAATSIVITSTFVAEPVETSLSFWMQELKIPAKIAFAPYNQVFQQLLDPTSLAAINRNGVNIVFVRLEDWQRKASNSGTDRYNSLDTCREVEGSVQEFIRALTASAERNSSTYLVCLCPSHASVSATSQEKSLLRIIEERMISELSAVDGVEVIAPSDLAMAYPVAEVYDHHGDRLAHIPYTPVFYTVLGSMISRRLFQFKCAPYKAVVLDCDETLWAGVCGEDGPGRIKIDAARKTLQEFIVQQHEQGMLICLCSKNNQEDVLEVFASRDDMTLTRDHITAWRINWRPKSENLRSLAGELGLDLDSFIFIDDDPAECAEVRANCPEILTLQLPKESESIPGFLNHVWAFDHRKATDEDRQRTSFYRQQIARERIRRESPSLRDFLNHLELDVDISALSEPDVKRVSELTFRTNQFNLTSVRRTETEIRQLCRSEKAECLIVRVKDRFGDYGLVGAVIFEPHRDSLIVDTFLLSCRALGRGVEHQMLARLGQMAKRRGLSHIGLRGIPSKKNRPALDFVEGLDEGDKESVENGFLVRLTVDFACSVRYDPEAGDRALESTPPSAFAPTADARARISLLSSIPAALYEPELIHKWISDARPRPYSDNPFAAPHTPVEKKIAEIYSEFLGIEEIGIHDSFFDLGGHSLLAMQVLSRVNKAFQIELDPVILFTSDFTVTALADAVLKEQVRQADPLDVATLLQKLSELTDDEAQALSDNPALSEEIKTK